MRTRRYLSTPTGASGAVCPHKIPITILKLAPHGDPSRRGSALTRILVSTCLLSSMLGAPDALLSQSTIWQPGGSLAGGYVTAIATNKDGIIIAASREGTLLWQGILYRSTDGGKSWVKVTQTIPSIEVKSLAAHPDGTFFAGTTNGRMGSAWRSIDGGVTWSMVLSADPFARIERTYTCFAFGPRGEVYAGYLERGGTYKGGVMKSTDRGATWVQAFTGGAYDDVVAVAADSQGFVYAGFAMGGLRRSTNNGATWTLRPGPGASLASLVVADSGHVLAGTYEGTVLRSTNSCSTWTVAGVTGIGSALLAVPHTRTIVGGGSLFGRSTDNGRTWTTLPPRVGRISALCRATQGELFAATDGVGIVRTADQGEHWEQSGPCSLVARDLSIGAGSALFALAGGGMFISTDLGDEWEFCGKPHVDIRCMAHAPDGDVYLGTWGGGVFRSTDRGGRWTPANTGLVSMEVNVLAARRNGRIVAGTTKGIWGSTDAGNSWAMIGPDSASISTLAWGIGEALFAVGQGRCYRSMNAGISWTSMVNSRCDYARSIAVGANGHIFCWSSYDQFSCSTNGGTTWIPRDPTGYLTFTALVVGPTGTVFVGTTTGCLRSTDEGSSWSAANEGLLDSAIAALAVDSTGVMFASTAGGIHRTFLPTVDVAGAGSETPGTIDLQQNYPNPFNPSTTIRYGLPGRSHVSVTVFNTLGQQVSVLQNGDQEAGYHEVRFDGSHLPSGVYYCRLQAGSYAETKKLLLVR